MQSKLFLAAAISVAAVALSNPAFALGGGRGAGPAAPGAGGAMGVGPSGPVGNAGFVGVGPSGFVEGVGPSGPTGNASLSQFSTQNTFSNGNNGTFTSIPSSSDPRTALQNAINGNNAYGFSTQGYGYGAGSWGNAGYGAGMGGLTAEEILRREAAMKGIRLPNSIVDLGTSLKRRGGSITAVKQQLVNGTLVSTEGSFIQEYGTRAGSGTAVANRSGYRTTSFARVIPKTKKHNHCACVKH